MDCKCDILISVGPTKVNLLRSMSVKTWSCINGLNQVYTVLILKFAAHNLNIRQFWPNIYQDTYIPFKSVFL